MVLFLHRINRLVNPLVVERLCFVFSFNIGLLKLEFCHFGLIGQTSFVKKNVGTSADFGIIKSQVEFLPWISINFCCFFSTRP